MGRQKGKRAQSSKPRVFQHRPFDVLKSLGRSLPEEKKSAVGPRPAVTPPPAEEEKDIFLQAMSGVTPLVARPLAPHRPTPPLPKDNFNEREEAEVQEALERLVRGKASSPLCETAEIIEGLARDAPAHLLERLRAGDFAVQAHLDLHGLDRAEARTAVEKFLEQSARQGKRCLLIIHGRGRGSRDGVPVLKNALAAWLNRSALRKRILAYATARPCDGGSGAVYVLLKG